MIAGSAAHLAAPPNAFPLRERILPDACKFPAGNLRLQTPLGIGRADPEDAHLHQNRFAGPR